jgi:hypothetical protein
VLVKEERGKRVKEESGKRERERVESWYREV